MILTLGHRWNQHSRFPLFFLGIEDKCISLVPSWRLWWNTDLQHRQYHSDLRYFLRYRQNFSSSFRKPRVNSFTFVTQTLPYPPILIEMLSVHWIYLQCRTCFTHYHSEGIAKRVREIWFFLKILQLFVQFPDWSENIIKEMPLFFWHWTKFFSLFSSISHYL